MTTLRSRSSGSGLALALLAVVAAAALMAPLVSAEKKIPLQKKTTKGRKVKECFDRHAKAVGHEFINPETGEYASPTLQPDLSELIASHLSDGQVTVGAGDESKCI